MKTRRLLPALLSLVFVLPMLSAAQGRPAPQVAAPVGVPVELTVYYYDRLPFFGDIDGRPAGRLIDVARRVFDTSGIRYELVNVPVVRFFETLKKPGNHCVLGALRSKEREAIYTYSDDFIYRDQPFRIIINRDKRDALPDRPNIRQILESPLRVGVAEGYRYGDWLDGKLAEHRPATQTINIGNQSERMHQMIAAGRFDYMFAVAEEADFVVNRTPENKRQLASVEIADAPPGNKRYLLCSQGIDPALLRRINIAISQVKADAGHERLFGAP